MLDNDISVDHAVGISGGAMAACALLGGSDMYIGIRQGIVDLVNECCGLVLLGFNIFFMNFYFHYCWSYVCQRPTSSTAEAAVAEAARQGLRFTNMATRRTSAKDLSGRLHILAVAGNPASRSFKPIVINEFANDAEVVRVRF